MTAAALVAARNSRNARRRVTVNQLSSEVGDLRSRLVTLEERLAPPPTPKRQAVASSSAAIVTPVRFFAPEAESETEDDSTSDAAVGLLDMAGLNAAVEEDRNVWKLRAETAEKEIEGWKVVVAQLKKKLKETEDAEMEAVQSANDVKTNLAECAALRKQNQELRADLMVAECDNNNQRKRLEEETVLKQRANFVLTAHKKLLDEKCKEVDTLRPAAEKWTEMQGRFAKLAEDINAASIAKKK